MKADHIVEALTGDSEWKDMIPQVDSSDFPTQWVPSAYECSIIDAQAKEIEKLRGHLRHLCRNCDLDRLKKLAEADKDGRLVVLPCKVGDTVYRIVRDADPHIARDEVRNMYFADDMTLCVELVGGRIILSEKFGKTVFLTREEAKRALEAMKDGN